VKVARKRLLLVSNSGGVLLELLALERWWRRHQRTWAVVQAHDTAHVLDGERIYWIRDCSNAPRFALLPALVEAWRILRVERPDLIVSAGSGSAVAFFLLSRLLGIPAFWLSTLNIVEAPGLSARICSRLASRVLVQRKSGLAAHPRAIVIGELY
jgi:UDP-N-acetylglucosamine:LPS N-acetylglucosamine transferase